MNKKVIALTLAAAMSFSTITAAFADTAIPADAQAAKNLGMLIGKDASGVTPEYLNENPTRIQSAIMFLRLKGLYNTATAFTGTDNFADAAQMQWAEGKNILAYLKAHPELGFVGVGNNVFNAEEKIDAASYYKVMLEALGYKQGVDFQWADVKAFAATKGLAKVADDANFQVADIATATIEALKANTKAGKALAAQLVETGVIDAAKAIAAGVYVAPVATLAVESVKSTNLKETVVTFNKEVDADSAETASNYQLDGDDINATVELNADKKSVTITWADGSELDNQTEYDLTVEGVLDTNDVEIEEVEITFLANDVTLPVAESVKLVGPSTFEIKFTEPVKAGTVTVEDKDFDYEVAEVTVDGNVATVELSDEALEAGNYTVTVSDFQDFANLKGLKKNITLAYAKDTTAPVATVTEATQTKVVVEFNKPVFNGKAADGTSLDASYFYHTYTGFNPVHVVNKDDQKFTLYFTEKAAEEAVEDLVLDNVTDRPLSEGTVKFTIVADADDNITDAWGNELKNNITTNLTIAADTTAPTVTKVEVEDQQTVLVYFSEDVVVEADNFTVVDEDGEEVALTASYEVTDADEYVATLTFADADVLEGAYTLTVEDVVDRALEENEITKVSKNFTVADETAPSLAEVEVVGVDLNEEGKTDAIYVTFPEDMATTGAYSVLDKDNYQIMTVVDGQPVFTDLKTADKIATFNGNDTVKITIADSRTYNVANESATLVIGRVADALGNKVSTFNVGKEIAAEVSPEITSVKTLAEKAIEITIDAELKAVNKSYIMVAHDDNAAVEAYSIKSVVVEDGETVIVAVLPATEKLTDSNDTDITVSVVDQKFQTTIGTKMDAFTFAVDADRDGVVGTVTDGFAPSILDDKEVDTDGIVKTADKTFTITFDEDLNADMAALYAQDLVVKNAKGDILVAGVDYETTVLGSVITVEIIDTDAKAGDYKVSSAATIKYIRDDAAKGNKANAFTTVVTIEDLVE